MALSDEVAERAVGRWIDAMDPPVPAAARDKLVVQFRPLVAAIFQAIQESADVVPGSLAAGGDAATGVGRVR